MVMSVTVCAERARVVAASIPRGLGDPEQMIKDNLPGKEVGGNCIVTQDCPAGFDCVIADFEGHCVKL